MCSFLLVRAAFCVLIAAIVIDYSSVVAAEFPLASQTFSIKSVIKPFFSFSKTFRVTEDYSYEQKRARIQYSLQDNALRTFYYNDNELAGIQYKIDSSTEDQCKHSTVEEFNREFYKSLEGLGTFMNEIKNAKFGHIVGPAKLLLMIAARSKELTRVSMNSTQVIFGGTQDLIEFQLNLSPESAGHDLEKMIIFYDAASFLLEPSPETQLPKIISLPSFRVVITYSIFKLNFEDASSQNERMDMNRIEVDHFTFPTSDKCSSQLPTYDLFAPYSIQTFSASFSAFSEDSTGIEEEHLVEFDGMRQVLRVDNYNYGTTQSTSDIFDFRMDRRYIVWDEDEDEDDEEGEGRCIMVKNLGNRRGNVHMGDLLTGGHQEYSLLGRAKVRGINALVYSVPALNLPYWYDKPLLYKRDQIDWLRRKGRTVYSVEKEYIVGFYTLVYVSDTIEDRLKLLAMEVMHANSIHLLTVHFYDFVWQLSEPTSGLLIDQLFSPIESCSAGARDDNYVDVSMALELDNPPASNTGEVQRMKTIQQRNDANNSSSWIDYWPMRDAALLASISDSLEIDVTMIHDLESKLIRTNSECRIDVNFRLSERPLWLHELNYVGGADMRPAGSYIRSSDVRMKKHVQSLRDCLDLLVPSNNLSYVYYSELDSACVIDSALNGLQEEKLHQLELISQKGKPSIGELYQVITRRDSVNFMKTLLRDGSARILENRLLILSHSQADPAMPIDPNTFNMRIKRINLQNVNYLRRDRGKGSCGKGVRTGYTLVPAEGDNFTYIVESKSTYEGNLPLKNLVDCQTACIADFTCESYSFCIYFPETVCTLSKVMFSSIESYASDQIENKTREESNGTTTDSLPITLRKDFRCEIHEKHYSDYFYNKQKSFIMLDDFLAKPANNSDDCARNCAQETIRRLQEQIDLQQTMHGHSEVKLEQQAEFIDQYKDDMRKICQQFHYITAPIDQVNREALQYYLGLEELQQNNENGYCLFDQHNQSRIMENRKRDSPFKYVTFKADLFELDFSKLYKREAGFKLIKSEQTKEEQDAILSYAVTKSEEKVRLLIQLDSSGRNLQYTFHVDEKRCAQLCFHQYAGLCRSFDIFQEKLPGGLFVNKCNLNSQSIMRYNLAGKNVGNLKDCTINETNVWHYELRWDILVKPLMKSQSTSSITDIGATTTTNFGGFVILLVMIASILSGLAFGLRLGQRLSPSRRLLNVPDITDPLASE